MRTAAGSVELSALPKPGAARATLPPRILLR
jgi:hypothetical protein